MKKKTFLGQVSTILILVVLFYLWFPRKSQQILWTDNTLNTILQPFQKLGLAVKENTQGVWAHYISLHHVAQENQVLKEQISLYKLQIQSLQNQISEQNDFKNLERRYPTKKPLAVRIVSEDPFLVSQSVMISAGKNQGVRVNSVVVTAEGLVGRVLKVFDEQSQVILITDAHFYVDAMSKRNRQRILIKGASQDGLRGSGYPFLAQSEYFLSNSFFEIGEELVTSGLGSIFPEGIPVGKIVNFPNQKEGLFTLAQVLPAVDLTKTPFMYVLLD